MIDPRVKSQARGQNNGSRALKWGIAHLFNLNGSRDMIKTKYVIFFNFAFFYKNAKFEKLKSCCIYKSNLAT